jgi:hypothetical protein
MKRRTKEAKRYAPTYKIARTLATLAVDLLEPPFRLSFEEVRETISDLADASSEKTFSRYTKALGEVFDGVKRPELEIDCEKGELRLACSFPPAAGARVSERT